MMKRFLGLALFAFVAACGLQAQVVDTTVCAVLNNPAGFDGKMVRIKGTVEAGFDQFVIKDGDCKRDVNGIWIAYPAGSKAKGGPLAMVELQPAHNFAGKAATETRAAVKLEKDKTFKQFDSYLAQLHDQAGMCPGCPRYTVEATLTGRLDGVADAVVRRDNAGRIVSLGGFGNLNAYPARLVVESVTDVTAKAIDYAKIDALVKKAQSSGSEQYDVFAEMAQQQGATGGSQAMRYTDPLNAAQKLAAVLAPGAITTQIEKDLTMIPKPKEQNGVSIGYGTMNETAPGDDAAGEKDSPDGVLYNCTFARDRLPGVALSIALMHLAQHVADIRSPQPGNESAPLFILENNAWAVTATLAVADRQKFLTLPGGYLMWNSSWPDADKVNNMETALDDFLNQEEGLSK